MVTALFFYLFSALAVASGIMVISSKNPVHAVLYLILAFFNSAGLFLLLGAEFVAMILVIVYVGAVAVLFLFVVMMLDINFAELRANLMQALPVGVLIGLVLLSELILSVGEWTIPERALENRLQPIEVLTAPEGVTNSHALGQVLYTDYILAFQGSGMVLLVAMIGAIVLTLRAREGVRRQSIADQVARRREDVIVIHKDDITREAAE